MNQRNGKQNSYEEESIEENVGGAGAAVPRNMNDNVQSNDRMDSGDLPEEYSDENANRNGVSSQEVMNNNEV